MKVVLDCNVLISAGLNAGTCRAVLGHVVRTHQLILSRAILREYLAVARRPRFADAETALVGLIKAVSRSAVLVQPEVASIRLPDPQDRIYLDAAISARADVLITGNKKHFPQAAYDRVHVVSPREFLDLTEEPG
jgi:putative PIN family toxin of toxin-antitoxin system